MTATGDMTPVQGKTMLEISLRKKIALHRVLVTDIAYEVIVDLDFLREPRTMLDMKSDSVITKSWLWACWKLKCRVSRKGV